MFKELISFLNPLMIDARSNCTLTMANSANAGSRQEIQKKILEEIQQQKKQLQMKTQPQTSGALPTTITPTTSAAVLMTNVNDLIPGNQRAALQHAHAHSVGYFITQDSSFGNLILPVIPRIENK